MFSRLSDKLQNAFERLRLGFIVKRKNNKSLRFANSVQLDAQAMREETFQRFRDLDYLSGSWVADEAFDDAVKAFDVIDQPVVR